MSAWSQGGVNSSVSSDHVIAEEVRPIHREHQLRPAVGAGGLESDGQGEIPDNPDYQDIMISPNAAPLTFPPCRGSFC